MANKTIIDRQLLGSQQHRGGNSAKPAQHYWDKGSLIVVIAGKRRTRPWRVRKKEKRKQVRRRAQKGFGLRDHYYLARRLLAQRLACACRDNNIKIRTTLLLQWPRKRDTAANEALQGITAQVAWGLTSSTQIQR